MRALSLNIRTVVFVEARSRALHHSLVKRAQRIEHVRQLLRRHHTANLRANYDVNRAIGKDVHT